MLEAHERKAASADHELARIRGTDADHEIQIDRTVRLEQLGRAAQALFGDRDDIDVLEQSLEIGAVGAQRRRDDRLGVW